MTPDSNSLLSTLKSVAKGNISAQIAQEWIEKNYVLKKAKEEISLDGFKNAFEKIKRFQENLTQTLPAIGFSANTNGIESKLSLFRSFHMASDSVISDNQVIGSQIFDAKLTKASEMKGNKFVATQINSFSVVCSNLNHIQTSLVRIADSNVQESRFEQNKLSRSILSSFNVTESDFMENHVIKSGFSGTSIHSSRVVKITFESVEFQDCHFEKCNIEGIEFENCHFQDCSFTNIQLNLKEPLRISNKNLLGKSISNCQTAEEFLAALDMPSHQLN